MPSAAMHIARTGLDAQDTRMRVISNNLANVNTTGFKRDRAAFETLSYQTITAAGAASTSESKFATGLNLGTGVRVAGTARIETQGSLNTTGNSARHGARRRRLFPGAVAGRHARLHPRRQFQPLGRRPDGHRRRLSGDARHHRAGRRDLDHDRHRRHRIGDRSPARPPRSSSARSRSRASRTRRACSRRATITWSKPTRRAPPTSASPGRTAAARSARACSRARTSTSSRNSST